MTGGPEAALVTAEAAVTTAEAAVAATQARDAGEPATAVRPVVAAFSWPEAAAGRSADHRSTDAGYRQRDRNRNGGHRGRRCRSRRSRNRGGHLGLGNRHGSGDRQIGRAHV